MSNERIKAVVADIYVETNTSIDQRRVIADGNEPLGEFFARLRSVFNQLTIRSSAPYLDPYVTSISDSDRAILSALVDMLRKTAMHPPERAIRDRGCAIIDRLTARELG